MGLKVNRERILEVLKAQMRYAEFKQIWQRGSLLFLHSDLFDVELETLLQLSVTLTNTVSDISISCIFDHRQVFIIRISALRKEFLLKEGKDD